MPLQRMLDAHIIALQKSHHRSHVCYYGWEEGDPPQQCCESANPAGAQRWRMRKDLLGPLLKKTTNTNAMLHYRSGVSGMGSGVGWQQSCMTWESMISLTKEFPGTLILQSRRLRTSRLW